MPEIQEKVNRYFATTVALVTTIGKSGPNVMAAEWALQVSYEPMLLAIFIHDSPTLWNIKEVGAFGVNIAADDQAELVNIAGGYSLTEIDKLALPGIFATYGGKDVPLIEGCALACECRVVSVNEIGDHVMVVGKVLSATFDENKSPLIYTRGNYNKIGRKLESSRKIVSLSPEAFAILKRISDGQFVLKAAVAVVKGNDDKVVKGKKKIFFVRMGTGSSWMLPAAVPRRGKDYRRALSVHLASIGLQVDVGKILGIKRMTLKSGKQVLRANFVIFDCTAHSIGEKEAGAWFLRPPKNLLLRDLLSLLEQS